MATTFHTKKPSISSTRDHQHGVQNTNENWNVDNWSNEVFKFEQDSLIKNKLGLIVNKRYQIVQRIDSGAFGSTYIGEDLQTGQRVAVKFDTGKTSEQKKSKKEENHLKYEFEVYKSALYNDGIEAVEGFPQVYWFGNQYGHSILVMELLGASVASLFTFCDRKFGWQTILSLAQQMICRIRHIHHRGFIHRDLKPENFLMGLSDRETTCYLIDFGLARRYRFRHPEDRTLKHIPFRRGRSFIGTAKYASVNSHRSVELSRRDDLESVGYVLIELINGHLPWRNICRRNPNNKRQTCMRIRAAKEQANWREICPPMSDFMRYCRELDFAEEPDYEKLLGMLRQRLIEEQASSVLPRLMPPKCDACVRAQDVRAEKRTAKIDRIDEEVGPLNSTPEDVKDNEFERPDLSLSPPADPTIFLKLGIDAAKLVQQLDNLQLNGQSSTQPISRSPLFLPPPSVKMSQSTVDSFSQHSSLENLKSNLSANVDLSPAKRANSDAAEEDSESIASCHNCRQQQQNYFDREFNGDSRLSWMIWRESTPENRFDYANRFSWTLPVIPKPNHFPAPPHGNHMFSASTSAFSQYHPPPLFQQPFSHQQFRQPTLNMFESGMQGRFVDFAHPPPPNGSDFYSSAPNPIFWTQCDSFVPIT
ncbi:Protein kinase domain-containing protein [Aphelenchoides besseyi]|nr:Protein kinase domain-containing protein [Aphelenchoides besseyi]